MYNVVLLRPGRKLHPVRLDLSVSILYEHVKRVDLSFGGRDFAITTVYCQATDYRKEIPFNFPLS